MTKLEAWKAWCESAGTPDFATEFTLEQSSHGKAFSFAWERGFVDGMQHQMKLSVEKALETKQKPLSQVKWDASAPLVMGEPVEREKVAAWMIERGYATGHGDSIEGLLTELEWQIRESEREAIARSLDKQADLAGDPMNRKWAQEMAAAVRARGEV